MNVVVAARQKGRSYRYKAKTRDTDAPQDIINNTTTIENERSATSERKLNKRKGQSYV